MKIQKNIVSSQNALLQMNKLDGYWLDDIWDLSNHDFQVYNPKGKKLNGAINFSTLKSNEFKNEFKIFIHDNIKSHTWAADCGFKFKRINDLIQLLSSNYPFCYSIIDLNVDKVCLKLNDLMDNMNFGESRKKHVLSLFKKINEYYLKSYDTRNEFEKDVWDIRNINPSKLSVVATKYYLKFTNIPLPFRELAKKYARVSLNRYSLGYCEKKVANLKVFLNYIGEKHSGWIDLKELNRQDIEIYIQHIINIFSENKSKNVYMQLWSYLIELKQFLGYIQAAEYEEAPIKPVHTLIFKEDIPKWQTWDFNTQKYIPEDVLQQFDANIGYLSETFIPIAIVLRATGLRISDVLMLKYDKCLELVNEGWYVIADICKTKIANHRIPITEEVALVIKKQIHIAEKVFSQGGNPCKYLFIKTKGKMTGKPPSSRSVSWTLNKLAVDRNIIDADGHIFHFKNHDFRHSKAVELINNGMNLLHVQKWLGHESPEMTLTYAKVLDTTLRKSWEEVMKSGLFRMNIVDGKVERIAINTENSNLIEWEYIRKNLDAVRIPLGYCLKSNKVQCNNQLNPCLTCINMCTSPEFAHEFEIEIEETKRQIERAKNLGRAIWVEKNQIVLQKLEAIYAELKGGKIYHKAGKKNREYVGDEKQVE